MIIISSSSSSVQGGVRGATTKAALRDAVKADPSRVHFYATGLAGGWSGPLSAMPEGVTLVVVGPDPRRKRAWFATVTRTSEGIRVA